MPSWLSQITERTVASGGIATGFDSSHPVYCVLDQRRNPDACAALLGQDGLCDYMTLFAGTSLSPLLEASPWLLELTIGSPAWQAAEALCRERRLGWTFQPQAGTPLETLTDHLRSLFVLDDPHGGQSLVNIQDPAVWTTLLAEAETTTLPAWQGLLGAIVTPTPQGNWQGWHPTHPTDTPPEGTAAKPSHGLRLTHGLEHALKEAHRAWWLSQATDIPLQELPPEWLERLAQLAEADIARWRDRKRLLPLVRHADAATWRHAQATLLDASLTVQQKISELERHS